VGLKPAPTYTDGVTPSAYERVETAVRLSLGMSAVQPQTDDVKNALHEPHVRLKSIF
jgi:hypothetical protein